MPWNYRALLHEHPDHPEDPVLLIHSVHYGPDGEIVAVSTEGTVPAGQDEGELLADLRRMQEALLKPILTYADVLRLAATNGARLREQVDAGQVSLPEEDGPAPVREHELQPVTGGEWGWRRYVPDAYPTDEAEEA